MRWKKKKSEGSNYIIYIIAHKRDEFWKSNLKQELTECSQVILYMISDMNKSSFTQNCVVENVLWVF
jgi:hypothetical protein